MRPPPGLKGKMVSRDGTGHSKLLVLTQKQKVEYWNDNRASRNSDWPVRDYLMPCSLPTHKKVFVASHKAFELCDYYQDLTKNDGIRDPCINCMYKVTGEDASPKYWSTGMIGMGNFKKMYSPRRLQQIIENSLTQNYDISGQGKVRFSFQIMWREPAGCCKQGEVPPQLLKKDSVFKIYNDDGRCGQRVVALYFLFQNPRKNMFRYYTVPKKVIEWDQATRKVCDDIDYDQAMCIADFQLVTDEYGIVV